MKIAYPLITLQAMDKKYQGLLQDFLTKGEKYEDFYVTIEVDDAKEIIAKYKPTPIGLGTGGCCGG